MLVREARAAAAGWVVAHPPELYRGAFLTGSAIALGLDEELPCWSDVDVMVVVDALPTPPKVGKVRHDGALLDIAYLSWVDVADPERVAATYYLAPSFTGDHALADPTGHLNSLRAHIAPGFAEPEEIGRRSEDVVRRIRSGLAAVEAAGPWHEQVLRWLFPASLPTQLVLVAALRPPTVRLRYAAARAVLAEHGRADVYERLLELLGCAAVRRRTVQQHLNVLAGTFDLAGARLCTPTPFAGDIAPTARPIAIDGSQDLLDKGNHREAVFWIVATLARCSAILDADAPASVARPVAERVAAATAELLGVTDVSDLRERARELRAFLPAVQAVAQTLVPRR